MKFKHGIRFRLLLLGIVPASLMTLTLVAYDIHSRVKNLEFTLRERGQTIARQMATASVYGVFSGNHEILQGLADATLLENDVTEVAILGASDNVLVVSQVPTRPPPKYEQTFTAPVLNPIRFAPGDELDPMMMGTTEDAIPNQLGTVRVTLSLIGTRLYEWEILRNSILITIAGLFVIGILANKMGKKVSEPLIKLTEAVLAVSEGRLRTRANFPAEAEIAELKAGFNAMAEKLERSHEHLQSQIDTATARLQETLRSLEEKNLRLEQARRMAEAQNEIKSQFLAHMSHEIRTPMNGVVGFAELLAKTPLTLEQRDQVQLIDRSARSLLSIINEILDLSKLESGKFSLADKEFELRPCIEDAVALLTPQAKTVRIIQAIDSDIPVTVRGDPVRIQQVLTNLLGNAIKFTREGRVVVRVRRLTRQSGDSLLISVSDTGCGIAEADRPNLFSPFLQLSEYAIEQERGTGLGLAISKNIVERMQGTIGVATRPGLGSTFWFALPLVACRHRNDWIMRFRGALIDACPINRSALRQQLQSIGGEIHEFHSISDILYAPDHSVHRFDFILIAGISDTRLSGAACCHLLSSLRARFHSAIVVLQHSCQRDPNWQAPPEVAARLPIPCRSEILQKTLQTISQRPAGPMSPDTEDARLEPSSARRFSFLIADDNEINRLLLKTQLSSLNADIEQSRDGKETLEAIERTRFDLIFLDLQMPHASGLEIVRILKEGAGPNRDTPVVAITAHALPEKRQRVLEAGFDECLIKPILAGDLQKIIRRRLPVKSEAPAGIERRRQPGGGDYVDCMLEKTQGDRALAQTLFETLFNELPEQLAEIEHALSHSDFERARMTTHKLNGSAGFCGFQALRNAARALETALMEGRRGDLKSLFDDLKKEGEHFLASKASILETL